MFPIAQKIRRARGAGRGRGDQGGAASRSGTSSGSPPSRAAPRPSRRCFQAATGRSADERVGDHPLRRQHERGGFRRDCRRSPRGPCTLTSAATDSPPTEVTRGGAGGHRLGVWSVVWRVVGGVDRVEHGAAARREAVADLEASVSPSSFSLRTSRLNAIGSRRWLAARSGARRAGYLSISRSVVVVHAPCSLVWSRRESASEHVLHLGLARDVPSWRSAIRGSAPPSLNFTR